MKRIKELNLTDGIEKAIEKHEKQDFAKMKSSEIVEYFKESCILAGALEEAVSVEYKRNIGIKGHNDRVRDWEDANKAEAMETLFVEWCENYKHKIGFTIPMMISECYNHGISVSQARQGVLEGIHQYKSYAAYLISENKKQKLSPSQYKTRVIGVGGRENSGDEAVHETNQFGKDFNGQGMNYGTGVK